MKLIKAADKEQWKRIRVLYEEAFPACEKKPFWLIRKKNREGKADVWYLEKEGVFAGLAITMNAKELVLLDYFAIDGQIRGRGLGSEALKALLTYYAGKKFFLEIENVYEPSENEKQRKMRKQFYLKNDLTEQRILAKVFGAELEVLGYRCSIDFETYRHVYEAVYGKRAAKGVALLPYPEKAEEELREKIAWEQ